MRDDFRFVPAGIQRAAAERKNDPFAVRQKLRPLREFPCGDLHDRLQLPTVGGDTPDTGGSLTDKQGSVAPVQAKRVLHRGEGCRGSAGDTDTPQRTFAVIGDRPSVG